MAVWFLYAAAYCAVDIFGLISGYVGYSDEEKPFKMKNYALLWLQTVFLGLLVTVVFRIFKPDAVTGETWLKSVLPVTHDTY